MRRAIFITLIGCLIALGAPALGAEAKTTSTAVVALTDTGINPYHRVFRDTSPLAYRHPSTYIPGFPKDAKALHLSLDAPTYKAAVKQDCELWKNVELGQLYWFPGTRVMGITFEGTGIDTCRGAGHILDNHGHGTMTASRAAAAGYGACPECRIVMIQGFDDGIEWAADNADWIDVQSNSWGPFTPAWLPTGGGSTFMNTPGFVRLVEATARKQLAFWASGNGAATRFGWVGHATLIDPHMTPSVVIVGGHDSGYITTWPSFPPHLAADSCSSWAAHHRSMDRSGNTIGQGTSAATPYAAGSAARIVLEARRLLGDTQTGAERDIVASGEPTARGPLSDGKLDRAEWKELLFKTASPRPKGDRSDGAVCDVVNSPAPGFHSYPVKWTDVPEGYPEYLHIGYGATDEASRRLAFDVLAGRKQLPERPETDRYFEYDGLARNALHQVWRGP